MMKNKALRVSGENKAMFSKLVPLEVIDVKKSTVAAELAALAVYTEMSRSDISAKLGWAKSRVSKFLSGDANLTLAKISEYTVGLGYDFDIIFRDRNSARALQPWNQQNVVNEHVRNDNVIEIQVQTAAEVVRDINNGLAKDVYVSKAGYPSEMPKFVFSNGRIPDGGSITGGALMSFDNSASLVDVYISDREKNHG
jgi:transcriptional regulator with XRE-family HTH domain